MTERFPWEDAGAEPEAQGGGEPEDETSPAAVLGADEAPEPGEPVEPDPELQPDGDPRELETTEQGSERTAEPRPTQETPTPRHGDPLRPPARERPVARKEYYSIGEVSDLVGLPPHVLRYWESQFAVLNPSKNRSGNRAYLRKEIRLILLVKHLLYEEKYTVEGAKAKLEQLRRAGGIQESARAVLDVETVGVLREDLATLRELIADVV